jgi:hypothetical protein
MRSLRKSVIASVVLVGGLSLVIGSSRAVFAQSDPAIGTWKLNVAKSKYNPGAPPRSQTITITAAGNGITVMSRGTDSAGKPLATDYTVAFDGKDVPVKGSPSYDMTSAKRVDANTTELTRRKGGKVVQTARRMVSADGKTMTITTTGVNESGDRINNVGVFEKQ